MVWCRHRRQDLKDKAQALFIESTGIGIAFHSREGLLCVQQQYVLLVQLLQRCNLLLSCIFGAKLGGVHLCPRLFKLTQMLLLHLHLLPSLFRLVRGVCGSVLLHDFLVVLRQLL
jgi:hypothetical protein